MFIHVRELHGVDRKIVARHGAAPYVLGKSMQIPRQSMATGAAG
ncbi:hypothetical protein [Herbaspirillum rubrisubalbicans]|nr:hypothetical protein [Herbaspirillum rubrisubalbicans]